MNIDNPPVTCFLSFADSRMSSALCRIKKQAESMNFFDKIIICNEHSLDSDFSEKWKDVMLPGIRGFGYWCWKPYLMWKILESLPEGSTILYCDAGCHLNENGIDRLQYYYEELKSDALGIKAFPAYSSVLDVNEKRWTKGDVFEYFHCRDNKLITDTPQLASGHIFCRKNSKTINFLRAWYQAWLDDFSLIDDSPSKSPNFSGFIENRHDQSIFSILYKLNGGIPLPDKETESSDYSTMKEYPFWDLRDKGKQYKDNRLISRVRRYIKSLRIRAKIKLELFKYAHPKIAKFFSTID